MDDLVRTTRQTSNDHPASGVSAAFILAGAFYVFALPLVLLQSRRGRGAFDQINYHEIVIREFAERNLPDVSDYLSATTPGYHLVIAAVARFINDSGVTLQLTGSLFTAGLLGALAWATARAFGTIAGVLIALPALGSLYVFNAGVWMLPDNAGWLGVLILLLLALNPKPTFRTWAVAGLVLALLVMVRQIHLWSAAMIWTAAWLGDQAGPRRPNSGAVGGVVELLDDFPARLKRFLAALACTLPAFAIVAGFIALWDGLVPPPFQDKYHGGNLAAPAFVLTMFALFGSFYALFALPGLIDLWRKHRVALLTVALVGLLAGLLPETSYARDGGRYSGFWNVVRALPTVGERSPLIWFTSTLGALIIVGMVARAGWRAGWIFLAALTAFIAAQTSSYELWQRYSEPFALIVLPVMAAHIARRARQQAGGPNRWKIPLRGPLIWVGPAILGLGLGTAGAIELARSGQAQIKPMEELLEFHGDTLPAADALEPDDDGQTPD